MLYLICAICAICGSRFEFSEPHMGTVFRIVLYAEDEAAARKAATAAFQRVAQLDAALSDYKDDSELMRLPLAGQVSQPVPVSDDLYRVLVTAQEIAARTGGAFDVTVGPLVRLWRRARRTGELPDPESLAQARQLTGYTMLRIDPKTRSVLLKRRGMLLDLGGIAKGYAAQEALAVLGRHGIHSALVAAGGDIVTGEPPPGEPGWRVGVGSPPSQYLSLHHAAVSTSGDAEQHVEIGGVRYSHIVDPRTGLGVTGRSSVTVVAPEGALADALATAASVLEPERALALVDSWNGVAAFFVRNSQTFASRRWNAGTGKK
jgi:thiamine biosynthesis lipoprotein